MSNETGNVMRLLPRVAFLATCLVAAVSSGCDSFHATRLSDRDCALRPRVESARALASRETSRIANRALVNALNDSEPAIRYAAAAALERHLVGNHALNRAELKEALTGLVDLINDDGRGVHFAATPYYSAKRPPRESGFVRQRALLTLSAATGKDHGYDMDAWRREIDSMTGN